MTKAEKVRNFTARRLGEIQRMPENRRRAELARLCRGIGHEPGDLPELWGALLQDMPEEFLGKSGPSREEWAIYLALTLYAVHQQSQAEPMNRQDYTLGRAVREWAERSAAGQDWTESSILRRFNALATADTLPEIAQHLRGIVQLLRAAKGGAIPLDYPQLAADLYELQFVEKAPRVHLRWGQALYYTATKTENTPDKEEN